MPCELTAYNRREHYGRMTRATILLIAIALPAMSGCDDKPAKAKNEAALGLAIHKVMCADGQEDRALALSRVVELAAKAEPEETRDSAITDAAIAVDCSTERKL